MKIETEIKVLKGEGRDGLCNELKWDLIVGGEVIRPGIWRVTLEGPERPQKIEKAKSSLDDYAEELSQEIIQSKQ